MVVYSRGVCVYTQTQWGSAALHAGATVLPSIHKSMFNPLAKRPGRGEGGPVGGVGYETVPWRDGEERGRTKGTGESLK